MNYKDMKGELERLIDLSYQDFIEALVSIEKGIDDRGYLESMYIAYMENDSMELLHADFAYMIEKNLD